MGKSNGSTRSSSASSPRGISAPSVTTPRKANGMSDAQLYTLAERLYANGDLDVDPGDAVYAKARDLNFRSIEDSIEASTDYVAQSTSSYVQVASKSLDAGEARQRWGTDDFVRIYYEDKSLMDIVNELRTQNISTIYNKYRY